MEAVKSMHPPKAPSPDSFHVAFFKMFWNIVGIDITKLVLAFFNAVEEINKIFIVLISKVKNAANCRFFTHQLM